MLEQESLFLTIANDYAVNFGLLVLLHVSICAEVSLNNTGLRGGLVCLGIGCYDIPFLLDHEFFMSIWAGFDQIRWVFNFSHTLDLSANCCLFRLGALNWLRLLMDH